MSFTLNNIDPTRDDEFIEKIGVFFEWNDLNGRFGWDFEWFLNRCAQGNAPEIPSYNWGRESKKDTFDAIN